MAREADAVAIRKRRKRQRDKLIKNEVSLHKYEASHLIELFFDNCDAKYTSKQAGYLARTTKPKLRGS